LPIAIPCDASLSGLTVSLQELEQDSGAFRAVSSTPDLALARGF
jgi:hypothetical protein